MTVIVGVEHAEGVVIGGDSAATSGWTQTVLSDQKVFPVGDFVMGASGSPRVGQLMRYRFIPPPLTDIHDIDRYMACEFATAAKEVLKDSGANKQNLGVDTIEGSSLLVAVAGRLYALHADYQWERNSTGYHAVGHGRDFALASLHTTAQLQPTKMLDPDVAYYRLKLALEAACYWDASCNGPLTIHDHRPQRTWRNT